MREILFFWTQVFPEDNNMYKIIFLNQLYWILPVWNLAKHGLSSL